MTTKTGKRLLSLLLAAVMTLGLMPTMASAAEIEAGGDNISAGDTVYYGAYPQSEYTPNTTPESPTEGETYTDTDTDGTQFVYVAKPANDQGNYYKIEPIAWKVLKNSNGELFLISEKNLDAKPYHTRYTKIPWEKSSVRSWLNGYNENEQGASVANPHSYNFIDTAFGTAEQAAINTTALDNPGTGEEFGGNDTNDQIFFLSIKEAQNYFLYDADRITLNTGYTASYKSLSSAGTAHLWWLRSPGSYLVSAAYVNRDGIVSVFGSRVDGSDIAVRPAFNLNLASVIFTSAAAGGKSATVGSNLMAAEPTTGAVKLTVEDSTLAPSFAVTVSTVSGRNLILVYSDAVMGSNVSISAVVKNSSGEVIYYGKLAENLYSADQFGSVNVTIPDDFCDTDKLYVYVEQHNGDYYTDFASTPIEITVPVEATPTGVGTTDCTTLQQNDGTLTGVNSSMEYSPDKANWKVISGSTVTGLSNGDYYVRTVAKTTPSQTLASPSVKVTIQAFTATPEATPTAAIDYINEKLTGLAGNANYIISGGAYTADASGEILIASDWFGNTIRIVKKGDGTYTTDSVAQSLPIDARPGTPSVSYKNETVQGDNDGTITITNYNSSFIYEISNDGSLWSDANVDSSGVIENLPANTYLVRVKATNSNFKSNSATVVIAQGDTPTYTLNVEDVIFTAITEGDAQPASKEIMITSSGNSTATISSVTVSGTAFSIDDTNATPTVTSGGENDSYKIQPDASLIAGNYEETITVTYNGGTEAIAKVYFTVIALVDVGTPSITVQPQDTSVKKGNTATLSVTANVSDGGKLSYQWYSCDVDGANGTEISGTKLARYSPDTSVTGIYYYYVVVTNTNSDATGEKTASVTSDVATVKVTRNSSGGSSSSTSYTLTFETNGGSTISAISKSSSTVVDLSAYKPTRSGYTFTGWYSDKALTTKVTSVTLTKNTTVYAGWELNEEKDGIIHAPYISGYTDGTFRPDSSITRAETAQLLYNISGASGAGANKFSDVSSDKWYNNAVTYLTSNDVISGYIDGTFKPVNSITRAEFVALVVRYTGLTEASGSSFSDVSTDHWADGYIAAATKAGYISGYTDGSFRPNIAITRAEAVTVLNAMLGREIDKDALASLTMPFSDVPTSHWAYNQIFEAAVSHTQAS